MSGPVIEILKGMPSIVSAGHDGLFPYLKYPFDEIFVIAYRGDTLLEHSVDFWLPYGKTVRLYNHPEDISVKVHRSGVVWHDRTRDLQKAKNSAAWVSVYGISESDPRLDEGLKQVFTILPGSPMQRSLHDLLQSRAWRLARDFHTRHRDWYPKNKKTQVTRIEARRLERDAALVSKIKLARGSSCQICGFSFPKKDGFDYCEVHHLEWLADGGLDAPSNMIVLCANCHRQFHYGNVEIITHRATRIEILIDGNNYKCTVG